MPGLWNLIYSLLSEEIGRLIAVTKPAIKISAIFGAIILLVTAAFHITALPDVKRVLGDIELAFFRDGLVGMWTLPAMHWLFIACLSVGLSCYRSRSCAAILMAFGVWVLLDAALTFMHVGAFIGVYMLALAGLLLLASGFMLRKDMMTSD